MSKLTMEQKYPEPTVGALVLTQKLTLFCITKYNK
jgi:hypothetical protein